MAREKVEFNIRKEQKVHLFDLRSLRLVLQTVRLALAYSITTNAKPPYLSKVSFDIFEILGSGLWLER